MDEVFLLWIRLQVNHLLALGTITRAFGCRGSLVPQVTLLAVRQPQPILPPAMEPWKVTVHDLFTGPSTLLDDLDAKSVIDAILRHDPNEGLPNRHSVFSDFKPIHIQQDPTYGQGAFHCEVQLALLMKYPHAIPGGVDADLMALLQVRFHFPDRDAYLVSLCSSFP